VPAAVAALAEAIFDISASDLDVEMSAGVQGGAHSIVTFFAELITDGDMTTYVRPFGRTGAQRLDADAWDSDGVVDMIATGTCSRPANAAGLANHHVFLREVEVAAVLDCYGPPVCLDDRESSRILESERRLRIVLGALRGLQQPGVPTRLEDPTPLLDRFPNARIELNTTDIGTLVQMGREWLEGQLNDPANAHLSRRDFERSAIEAFKPLMNTTRFGYVWSDTVAREAYTHWKQPGRRAGRPSRQP
jgi:hypothetical protein